MNRVSRWCCSQDRRRRLEVLKIGSQDQPILAKRGDDLRIDWGYLYVAAPKQAGTWRRLSAGRPGPRRLCQRRRVPDGQDGHAGRRGRGAGGRAGTRRGKSRRPAGLALADAGLRRPVLDPVHAAEPAAVLAAERLGSGRPAAGSGPRPRGAEPNAAPPSTRNSWPT